MFLACLVVSPDAHAGSVSFGNDTGSGFGTVTIPYDSKLDVGDGAFNLEMWVKEVSRNPPGGQYTASFWSSTVQYYYHERANKVSSFMWGLSFDGPNLFTAWRANQNYFYPAGSDTGYTDAGTSSTKTAAQVYNTFADQAWHHIALSKTGVNGSLNMYLDGERVLYVPTDTQTYSLLGGDVVLGGLKFVGQIGDVRLVKGQALYTGPSFMVPTSQITKTSQGALASNVSLLLKASGTVCAIEDVSDNHFPVVLNGSTCSSEVSRSISSYNVQFDNQGHGTKPADQNGVTSIALTDLPSLPDEGYFEFLGWSETSTGSVLVNTFSVSTDSTLYAIWKNNTPIPKTVTYVLDYLNAPSAPTQSSVNQGSTFEVAANPVRLGYQFLGWTDNGSKNGSLYGGPSYIGKTYTVGSSDITLTANWESTSHPIIRSNHQNGNPNLNILASYFGNGYHTGIDVSPGWCVVSGTNSDPSTWVVKSVSRDNNWESFEVVPELARFTYGEAYEVSPDPSISFTTGATQSVPVGTAITSTSVSNLGCSANRFSISPDLPSGLSLNSQTGEISGTPDAVLSQTIYTLAGERWVDVSGSADVNGTKIGYAEASFTLTVSQASQTITFPDLSGITFGDVAPTPAATASSSLAVFYASLTEAVCTISGSTITVLSAGLCTIEASQAGDSSYSAATNVSKGFMVSSASQTITYDLAGGRYEKSSPTQNPLPSGATFKLASGHDLTKIGYSFRGWSDGTTTYAAGSVYTVRNANIVLTAVWTANQYKVSWNIKENGGKSGGTGGATKYTSGSQITSIASNAARTGKTFKGWYTAPKGGTKVTQSFIVPRPYGDVTFYAQFN